MELIISSEFFDSIPGVIEQVDVFCNFSPEDVEVRNQNENEDALHGRDSRLIAAWIRDGVAAYDVTVPTVEGKYRLRLRCELLNKGSTEEGKNKEHNIVLPWLSETLVVAGKDSRERGRNGRMLSCYREIDVIDLLPSISTESAVFGLGANQKFSLQEEYGVGIGSHIYDSAVVLMRYLAGVDAMSANGIDVRNRHDTAIELGSGCGLVGLFLGFFFDSVFLTDKSSQMPLLEANVARNQHKVRRPCHYHTKALNWSSQRDCDSIICACKGQEREGGGITRSVDLIVAADVLYDRDAAESLVALLLKLMTSVNQGEEESGNGSERGEPKVAPVALIAQKMRGEEAVDMATLVPAQLRPELVYEEYAVKVWLLTLKGEKL